jgi:DNA-directed RNA polymerase subunit RPC12/RpoP
MMNEKLKELFKPPLVRHFNRINRYIENGEIATLLKICFQYDGKLDDEIGDFVLTALNEKYEREFGEPDEDEEGVYCSDCKHFFIDEEELRRCKLKSNYTVDDDVKEPCVGFEKVNTEPLRWKSIADSDDWLCPVCNTEFFFNGHPPQRLDYRYCPHCGQWLLPPEVKE